jgi:hypothetical protein
MKEFWRWTLYGFRVCIFVTIFLAVLFFAFLGGTYILYRGKPFWAVPLGLVIPAFN